MKKLTSQGDDIVIVLDRLYGQPIISGRVKTLNAVSGLSDIDRFKLKQDSCIFTITKQATEFFHIPLIKGYAKETDMRFAAYAQVCKEQFKKLDDLIISR